MFVTRTPYLGPFVEAGTWIKGLFVLRPISVQSALHWMKKIVSGTGETTVFVYDASKRSLAEYSTIIGATAIAKTSYLTIDYLGSPRTNTDPNGVVTAQHVIKNCNAWNAS